MLHNLRVKTELFLLCVFLVPLWHHGVFVRSCKGIDEIHSAQTNISRH